MKKLAKLIAVMALVPAMLAGCGSSNDASDETTTAADTDAAAVTEEAGEDNSLQKVLDSGEFILGLDATFKPMGYTD